MIEIVPARREHVERVAATMRADDRAEVLAWSGRDPASALSYSLQCSALSWTGLIDGTPAAMFGVGAPTLLAVEASPWFLAADSVEGLPPRLFARMSREWVRRMRVFPVLANWSDARNERSHRWLSWLGFEFGEARPLGVAGLPFRPFAMETGAMETGNV